MASPLPVLESARLLLRGLALADAPAIHTLLDDAGIAANLLSLPHPYMRAHAESLIQWSAEAALRGENFTWGLVVRESGDFAGTMYLQPDSVHHRAELGYWIGRPYWGQGYATEAARRLLDYGFGTMRLHRIFAMCFTSNQGSARVLEKIGMVHEGTWRRDVVKPDGVRDVAFYGLLRAEYRDGL